MAGAAAVRLGIEKRSSRCEPWPAAACEELLGWPRSYRSATPFTVSPAASRVSVRQKERPEICSQPHHANIGSPGDIPVQSPSPSPAEGLRAEPPDGFGTHRQRIHGRRENGRRRFAGGRVLDVPLVWGRFPGTRRSSARRAELPVLPEGLGRTSAPRNVTETSGTAEGRSSGSSPFSSLGRVKLH